ncbi:aminoglycoside phosphotransferase family protein [Patescibacteria group bacterium]|nr:aminoglycoside phosphotransferase family protein [Patescibacteria group bacterium]
MEKKKPTLEQIQEYLKKYNPLDLEGAKVALFSDHNHLHYRVEKDNRLYCLRIINPASYRAGEWLTIPEEYTILKHLEPSGLGPKAYYVDPERFVLPLMIQEFVAGAVCFKDLGVLSEKHLVTAAYAIAEINSQKITPEIFPYREGFTRYSYLSSVRTWRERLIVIKKYDRPDVVEWVEKIEKIVDRAEEKLKTFEPLLAKAPRCFNFDGAHVGNTYWKDNKVIFLDWQKVSYGDPAFTLARFLTSIEPSGEVTDAAKDIMLKAYLKKREVPGFVGLLNQRLFERQAADLVWVVWHYVNEQKTKPVEKATTVAQRFQRVERML